jgi:hypothetical protein
MTILARAPGSAAREISELAICVALYGSVAHGVQTFRSLRAVSGAVLAMVVLVCGVGVHQALAPTGCVMLDGTSTGHMTGGRADGRSCETVRDCYVGELEPGAEYACEHVGLLGTTSVVGGRIRYRGVLQDPNELALAGSIGLPVAFAFGHVERGKGIARRSLAVLAFVLVLVCAVYTGSRGGQLVFLVVLGAYFLKRFGRAGLVLGAALGAPLLLLGGRSGAEASSSTMERLDCWAEAISIARSHPVIGVGLRQFGEYNDLTAHNSYLLTLSELGIPGMILFSVIVYVSAKIPIVVLREVTSDTVPEGAPVARPWATAMMAAFAGLGVGIFFLSFAYHYVLWIYIGLAGALYMSVRTHLPKFRIRFGWGDAALVAAIDVAVVSFTYLQTKLVLS